MEASQIIMQSFVVAIFAGVLMQVLAEKLKLPSIVFLLIAGILLGPQVCGLIQPSILGPGLSVLVSLSVALILFEGGLSLDFESFKGVDVSVRNMLTIGLAITVIGSAMACHFILGLDLPLSLLFGSFMSITGLTVINPILRRVKINQDLATILRSEGIFSNAIGAILSVAVLELILVTNEISSSASGTAAEKIPVATFLYAFFIKVLVGVAVGYLTGRVLGQILKSSIVGTDLKNLVVLAWVFGTYALSNYVEANTGILAVILTGFAIQKEDIPQLNTLKRFKGQLSILFISILFVLIAANLQFANFKILGLSGALIVLIVILVIRPIAVFLSNIGLLSIKDKIFLSWIGPKGIVSASVASLFTFLLREQGIQEAVIVETLVFSTIIVSVLAQGLTARVAAKACDCLEKGGYIIIVGANVLGRIIAKVFVDMGKDVCVIDNNKEHCRLAAEDDLLTVYGNCLDAHILEQAQIDKASIVIATTANSEVNFLACQIARDLYQVNNVYPAIGNPDKSVHARLVGEIGGDLAYTKVLNIDHWKKAIDNNKVTIFEKELEDSGKLSELTIDELDDQDWIPVILKRKESFFFAHSAQPFNCGDVLICLSKAVG
ncbi:MAG: cation:proton antiporter [Candidatus Caenarcaniphilales bacterium]|nr:cation:proton antiporter [Candidatus Caenarcaniphilales bacterium]